MPTAQEFLDAARSEIGYVEAKTNRTKFAAEAGHANGQPWCATFVVAMARRVGLRLPSESPYTPTMANGFKAESSWSNAAAQTPRPGDIVFFDFPDDVRRIQHVGIVESYDPATATVTTIEGNTSSNTRGSQSNGGGVYRRFRSFSYIVGFGRPTFTAAAAAPAPPAAPADWTEEAIVALPQLSRGSKGHHVKILQALLIAHAGDLIDEANLDADFGPFTAGVLSAWQKRTGVLAADGVCGPATWKWLIGA
jgi:hypothetical protein